MEREGNDKRKSFGRHVTGILFEVEIDGMGLIDCMYWMCEERARRVGVGGKWVGAEEGMNMGVWNKNGVGGREEGT